MGIFSHKDENDPAHADLADEVGDIGEASVDPTGIVDPLAPKAGGGVPGSFGTYDPSDPMAAMRMAQEAIANSPFGHGPLSHTPMAEDIQARLAQATQQIQGNLQNMEQFGGVSGAMAAGAAMGATNPAAPSPAGNDAISQLERLAALRNSGALTEEEFAAQKRRVLDEG